MKYLKIVIPVIAFLVIASLIIFVNPSMELKGKILEIEVNTETKLQKPKTKYFFKDITNKVKIEENIDYKKIGKYEVIYKVNTLHGKYTKKQIVKVVDKTAPEITLKGNENYEQSYKKEYEEPGFNAIDKYDGDLTEKVTTIKEEINENEYNIKYEVSDSSGNKASKIRKITLIDDVAPEITLKGTSNVRVYVNSKYTEQGATAKDEKDGDLTKEIKKEGSVNTSKTGIYKISYTVSDKKGNKAIKVRTVEVKSNPGPAKTGVDGAPGVIYLTFDDGPSSNITPKILDILKKKNVKATFFIINYNGTGANIVKRAYNEGHTIAIHGYSHDYATIYKSEEAFMNNIYSLQTKIKNTIGYEPNIIRFPGGSSNTVSAKYNKGIMTRLSNNLLNSGFRYYDWNVSSEDAASARTSEDVYRNVTKRLSKNRINMVLMHDSSGNYKTLNALEDIINYGIENGYTFSRITQNTPLVKHPINN